MPNFLDSVPWKVQPPQPFVGLDESSILYPGLESVMGGLPIATTGSIQVRNLNLVPNYNASQFYLGSNPIPGFTSNGVGATYSASNYVYGNCQATSAPWTLAAIIMPTVTPPGSTHNYIGCNNSAGSSTYDRQLTVTSGLGGWSNYIYDGNQEFASSGVLAAVGRADTIVIWATGSVIGVNANGVEVTTSVANSGYTGYSTPQLFIGDSSSAPSNAFVCPLCIRSNVAWSPGQRSAFIANPWQIFAKQPRTFLTYPVAGPVITGLSAIGASSGGFGGGYGIGAAGAAGD